MSIYSPKSISFETEIYTDLFNRLFCTLAKCVVIFWDSLQSKVILTIRYDLWLAMD